VPKTIDVIIDPDTAEVEIHANGFIMNGCSKELETILKMVDVEEIFVKEDDDQEVVYETTEGW